MSPTGMSQIVLDKVHLRWKSRRRDNRGEIRERSAAVTFINLSWATPGAAARAEQRLSCTKGDGCRGADKVHLAPGNPGMSTTGGDPPAQRRSHICIRLPGGNRQRSAAVTFASWTPMRMGDGGRPAPQTTGLRSVWAWGTCNVSRLEAVRQIAGRWLPSRNDPGLNREQRLLR